MSTLQVHRRQQIVDPSGLALKQPSAVTAQAGSLPVTPLPWSTRTVTIGCTRTLEQPLLNSHRDLGIGCSGMLPKVFCPDHLHAEIGEMKGDFNTGFASSKHTIILLQSSSFRSTLPALTVYRRSATGAARAAVMATGRQSVCSFDDCCHCARTMVEMAGTSGSG